VREQRSKKDEYQKALAAYGQAVKDFHKGEFEKAVESLKGFIEKFPADKEIVDRAKSYLAIAQKRPKRENVSLKDLAVFSRSTRGIIRGPSRSWRRPWSSRKRRGWSTISWPMSIA
jgi:predicted Zn-dependent protease